SELRGKYIFTDYSSGRIWAGTPNGTNTMPYTQIATDAGIVGFGEDPRNRDLLMADINDGSIRKLIYAADTGSAPATLGASGLFTNTAALSPASGVHPYEVALPYWTDGLQKRRWFSIPSSLGSIQPSETNWSFPNGSVWVQHFDLETTNGVPESKRPVETRVLVKSSDGIYGLSYRWAPGANEATLVGPGGEDAEIQVSSNGVASSLRWRFPARSECLRCHSAAAGYAIGFQPWQLNRQADVHGQQAHQIAALLEEDYFITSPTNIHLSKRPEAPENQSVSVEYRARSWLAANCAHCHQPGGNGPGAFDLRLALTTEQTGMINGSLREPKGDRRVIVPGSLENSELYQRLIIEGPGHMPPLDSRIPDPAGVALIAQWITNDLPSRPFYGNWLTNYFAIQTSAEAAPFADPDLDGGVNYLEFLTGTNPTNNASAWGIRIEKEDEGTAMGIRFDHLTNRLFELQVTQSLTNGMWRALDMPENTPYAPAQPIERVIVQPATNRMEFYRVSVFEP
ncbi:MAG TPA: hypothetical protein VEH27_14825, partial [Methylomirabilota bacterium]|nr:hypothetical protein [Methylomirabilota bacterium]